MILYFSGTGNSAYTAKRIGAEIQDETTDLFGRIRGRDFSHVCSDKPWVIVCPTYAWRIPRILQDWLKRTSLEGSTEIYFVMTCGVNIGNAGAYLKKRCRRKGISYKGCASILMPENYIALFDTPPREKALSIIERAEASITDAARLIREGKPMPEPKPTVMDRLNSGVVNDLFYPLFVHARKFYATDRCISCGKCAKLCPLNNIHLEDGKPAWGKDCTHCMACICRCPVEAIEYGKHSAGLPRYSCPRI